mmetsp:Transcript_21857/g.53576  ORF Transcript_21857/g.53576 Transcript_21857/m.53576 type:complete len:216 (+) Transcript_21857:2187-2834(+)
MWSANLRHGLPTPRVSARALGRGPSPSVRSSARGASSWHTTTSSATPRDVSQAALNARTLTSARRRTVGATRGASTRRARSSAGASRGTCLTGRTGGPAKTSTSACWRTAAVSRSASTRRAAGSASASRATGSTTGPAKTSTSVRRASATRGARTRWAASSVPARRDTHWERTARHASMWSAVPRPKWPTQSRLWSATAGLPRAPSATCHASGAS